MNPPVPYSPDLESLQADEAQTVQELNDTFDTILTTTSQDYGRAVRAVHAKAHGIIEASLEIKSDLPAELAQGLFARPGRHACFIRLSTNPGDILQDAISVPRGLALKVLDVEGERLPGAEGSTQDFIFVNGKVFQAKTAEQFLGSLKLLAKTTDRLEGAKVVTSKLLRGISAALKTVGIESSAINSLGGAPNVDPLGQTYYSVTPFRYGDYVAKFSLAPITPDLVRLDGKNIDASDRPNAIRETVQAEMRGIDAAWELRVQLCRNPERQPIEDSTVEWEEDEAPFRGVAILRASPQDSWDPALVRKVDEEMRFSVWTGLEAHRPLGNINRARRQTYEHSARFRERFNRCPMHEPTGRG